MRFAAAAAILCFATVARADTNGARWLREHGSMEWQVGAGGWRTSLGLDARSPGFQAVAGGTEVLLGLDLIPAVALFASGRFLAGEETASGDRYFEALGGAGVEVHLSDAVSLRAGPAAGRAISQNDAATLVGGLLAATIELFPLGSGRLSLALSARLDVDAMLGAEADLPSYSLALAFGIGLRY